VLMTVVLIQINHEYREYCDCYCSFFSFIHFHVMVMKIYHLQAPDMACGKIAFHTLNLDNAIFFYTVC
jgi:hypothetical protein